VRAYKTFSCWKHAWWEHTDLFCVGSVHTFFTLEAYVVLAYIPFSCRGHTGLFRVGSIQTFFTEAYVVLAYIPFSCRKHAWWEHTDLFRVRSLQTFSRWKNTLWERTDLFFVLEACKVLVALTGILCYRCNNSPSRFTRA
jgi:hypothetical protein